MQHFNSIAMQFFHHEGDKGSQRENKNFSFVYLRDPLWLINLELFQETKIVSPEISNVVNLITQHQLAFGTHAPGIA